MMLVELNEKFILFVEFKKFGFEFFLSADDFDKIFQSFALLQAEFGFGTQLLRGKGRERIQIARF